ncbi:MAG: type I restriction-modification system subunit M N-terminal domain-containing protein, partial [Chloroflexota bacterium]
MPRPSASNGHLDIKTLETWLWDAACSIRGALDAPKFKDYILPLIFAKRLSDVFDDTIANFRKTFLPELQELFVQILLLAQAAKVFQLGNISLDGSKIHADTSKSHAVSYKRLLELETHLRDEVRKLLTLGERADQGEVSLPEGLNVQQELALRQGRLVNLAKAKTVLEARAAERDAAEKAVYEAKLREREEKTRQTGGKPRGREPKPPQAGPRDKDQYNF